MFKKLLNKLLRPNIETLRKNRDLEGLLEILSKDERVYDKSYRIAAAEAIGQYVDLPLLRRAMHTTFGSSPFDYEEIQDAALRSYLVTAKKEGTQMVFKFWLEIFSQTEGKFHFDHGATEQTILHALASIGEDALSFLVSVMKDITLDDGLSGPRQKAVETLGWLGDLRALKPLLDFRMSMPQRWEPGNPPLPVAVQQISPSICNLRVANPLEFKKRYLECSEQEKDYLRATTGIVNRKSWPVEYLLPGESK